MDDKPFEELYDCLTRALADPASEAPERIVTRENGGPGTLWRLSGMDICPACRAIRDAFSPEGKEVPTARYCRLCKVLEVFGPGDGLLARRDLQAEVDDLLAGLAGCEPSPLAGDDTEEY